MRENSILVQCLSSMPKCTQIYCTQIYLADHDALAIDWISLGRQDRLSFRFGNCEFKVMILVIGGDNGEWVGVGGRVG